jgi:hypothetical protein
MRAVHQGIDERAVPRDPTAGHIVITGSSRAVDRYILQEAGCNLPLAHPLWGEARWILRRLKENFARVAMHGDEVALFFCSDLFLRHPETRDMFPVSMAAPDTPRRLRME